jgi:hypothetical protein
MIQTLLGWFARLVCSAGRSAAGTSSFGRESGKAEFRNFTFLSSKVPRLIPALPLVSFRRI